jgi:hypothetical protein
MGTRSLTRFILQDGDERNPITCIYRQYDGYPSGHGKQLAEFLSSGTMVNGYASSEERQFNGLGCLAAQFIKEFKDGTGNIYIEKPNAKDCGEEYIYEVIYKQPKGSFEKPNEDSLTMSCIDVWEDKTIFEGSPKEFHTILQTA